MTSDVGMTGYGLLKPDKDNCVPSLGCYRKVHTYKDCSYWNNEPHPTCVRCGFIDRTRTLEREAIDAPQPTQSTKGDSAESP